MTYTVVYDDGINRVDIPHELPDRLPQCGDVYEWVHSTHTLGGRQYKPGDRMLVLERTGQVPHYRTSSLGNLLVEDRHHTSVWTSFEHAIAIGSLKYVDSL